MAKVFVYDAYTNKFYKYNLSENDAMPYSYGNTMRLREFRGSSNSQTLWTTVAAMEAWNLTRRRYGKGIYIGYAYKRIWEGGHGTTSQHYAGVSFDVGQNVSSTERVRIRDAAVATKAWLCGTHQHDAALGAFRPPLRHRGLFRRRVPHCAPQFPQHLCAHPAGRAECAWIFHPHAGRHFRQ